MVVCCVAVCDAVCLDSCDGKDKSAVCTMYVVRWDGLEGTMASRLKTVLSQ